MIFETIFPGIQRLELPLSGFALGHVNCYLLRGKEGHILIDTGWNTEVVFKTLQEKMEGLGIKIEDLRAILVTHAHLDHCGLTRKLKERSHAVLMANEMEKRQIALRYRGISEFVSQTNSLLRQAGVPDRFIPNPKEIIGRITRLGAIAAPDICCRDGQILRHEGLALTMLCTPGHSPGHMCLYEAKHRVLFSGDHVLPDITPHIGFHPYSGSDPLGDYLGSLERLRGLSVNWVLPAHGRPFKGLIHRMNEIIEHHATRNRELIRLLTKSGCPLTPFELAGCIPWHSGKGPTVWQNLPAFDQRLAIFEIVAHGEALAHKGILEKLERRGVFHYTLGNQRGRPPLPRRARPGFDKPKS